MIASDALAEIRAWRDEFAKSHDYDLHAMVVTLHDMDTKVATKVIRGEPRRPVATKLTDAKTPIGLP